MFTVTLSTYFVIFTSLELIFTAVPIALASSILNFCGTLGAGWLTTLNLSSLQFLNHLAPQKMMQLPCVLVFPLFCKSLFYFSHPLISHGSQHNIINVGNNDEHLFFCSYGGAWGTGCLKNVSALTSYPVPSSNIWILVLDHVHSA